jgi:hypothetical protein
MADGTGGRSAVGDASAQAVVTTSHAAASFVTSGDAMSRVLIGDREPIRERQADRDEVET